MTNRLATLFAALLKPLGYTLAGIGGIASLASIILVTAWLWRAGWVDHFTPPAPVVERTVVAAPVALELEGPTTCIRGETYVFLARATGQTGRPSWRVIPETTGAIEPIGSDGMAVRFRSLDEGVFSIVVSVAGEGNQIANAHREFENIDLITEEVVEPAETEMARDMGFEPEPMLSDAAPLPTVAELTVGALANVSSVDRVAEARVIAGTIRSVIGRIETGLLPPETDVVAEIKRQTNAALGNRADNWAIFLEAVSHIVEDLRSQGVIVTAASSVPTLAEIAAVLQQAR